MKEIGTYPRETLNSLFAGFFSLGKLFVILHDGFLWIIKHELQSSRLKHSAVWDFIFTKEQIYKLDKTKG